MKRPNQTSQGSVLGRDPFARDKNPAPSAGALAAISPAAAPTRRRKKRAAPRPANRKAVPSAAEEELERVELLEASPGEEAPASAWQQVGRWLQPQTYTEQLGKARLSYHSPEVDPFGLDPLFWEKLKPAFSFLYRKYFRVETEGLENLPESGRVLVVANHSGTLPYDGAMLKLAVEEEHPARRPARFLVEDFVFHFPFLGAFINRIGGVRACPENAERLLSAEQVVIVFPEGIKGIGKLYRQRYRLQRFGRGGFVRLALRAASPILPVAVVGAEEIHPLLARLEWLARPLGLPYIPVTPTFPWLGPLGAIPLPSKWKIIFGRPLRLPADPHLAEDPSWVMETAEKVRSQIQEMIDRELASRKGGLS